MIFLVKFLKQLKPNIFDKLKIFETGRVLLFQNTKLDVKNIRFNANNVHLRLKTHV